jgi:diacylglycerol O-acyltransferase
MNHERMSSIDTAWLRMDSAVSSMMIVGVSTTATPLRLADFRRMLETRMLCFDRFRHKVVRDALGASWLEDEDFDLGDHLIPEALPEPAGRAELEVLVGELASTPLDARRPLWQVHLIERYGPGSAWVMRVHHCYADGIAMIRVLLSMTEQDPAPALGARLDARASRPDAEARQRGSADVLPVLSWVGQLARPAEDILESALAEAARLLENGVHQLFHPQHAAALARQASGVAQEFGRVLLLADDPDTPLRGDLGGYKSVAWGVPLPLPEVKTVGRALGCTINDVLMTTVAGALGGHLRDQGFDTAGLVLRASVPVNLRTADEPLSLGNRFGLVFVDLPVGIANPVERLLAVRGAMVALKGSLQPPMTLMVLGLMGMLPGAVQSPAIELFSRKASAVVSNVPGPQAPLYICGQRIDEMYFWVPQSGSIGLGISLLSYAGRVHFGVIADRRVVPKPAGLVARFASEFEKLLLAVTVGTLAAHEPAASATSARVGTRSRRHRLSETT